LFFPLENRFFGRFVFFPKSPSISSNLISGGRRIPGIAPNRRETARTDRDRRVIVFVFKIHYIIRMVPRHSMNFPGADRKVNES
jgi:hypothetical protein